jgi:hypothetical protein
LQLLCNVLPPPLTHLLTWLCNASTDIEQETNGLYSFKRQAKMDPAKVKAVIDAALDHYYKSLPVGQ